MKCRHNFNSFNATLFHSSFVWKTYIFYSKNIHYAYNFYGTDLYVSVWRGVLRSQQNICGAASLRKLQKSLIVDVWMGSNNVSSLTLTVEKVSRMSILVLYSHFVRVVEKFTLDLLSSWFNNKYIGLRMCNLYTNIQI